MICVMEWLYHGFVYMYVVISKGDIYFRPPSSVHILNFYVIFRARLVRVLHTLVNPFHSRYLQTGTLANSEDPDEMPHKAAFHLGLHCLLR